MTVIRVAYIGLQCDGCGARFDNTDAQSAVAARIAVAAAGWHYAEGKDPGHLVPGSPSKGQRQFDYCAECWPSSYHAKRSARQGTA